MADVASTAAANACQSVLDLFVPTKWSNQTMHRLLNETHPESRARLTAEWAESTLSSHGTIGLTAALIAGTISSAFSWTDLVDTHWLTKAFWYSGLIFALTSISAAALNTGALLRLKIQDFGDADVSSHRTVLGKQREGRGEWQPRAFQSYVWGMPGLQLKLGIFSFLGGLAVHVWHLAAISDWDWDGDALKVRCSASSTASCDI